MKPDCKTCHKNKEYSPLGSDDLSQICGECHTKSQVDSFTNDLTKLKDHADSLNRIGWSIAEELTKKGIVRNIGDTKLELKILFKDDSSQAVGKTLVERLNYYLNDLGVSLRIMVVGAAHSNPDYAHWYGNAPAKSDLIEIRDAANKLSRMNELYGVRSKNYTWYLVGTSLVLVVISMIVIAKKINRGG
jgi:hypothetical protein